MQPAACHDAQVRAHSVEVSAVRYAPATVVGMDEIGDLHTPRGYVVASSDLHWSFSRSGGPGGQHVNKTSSKVTLTIATDTITGNEAGIEQVRDNAGDEIRVACQTSRSQWRNRQLCLQRAAELIDEAARPPAPDRRPSKPTSGSIERRLDTKRRNSDKKQARQVSNW